MTSSAFQRTRTPQAKAEWTPGYQPSGTHLIASLNAKGLQTYLTVCSVCLARIHARTGDEIQIFGYTGKEEGFAQAITDFSVAHAD
ncbi:MAG: DUF2252 domain-containing protein [Chloroflexi bacterium]|nr:DUF2252 domain-containing protein [Chloroflexota bacterium]